MNKKTKKTRLERLCKAIEEAQKDPQFVKEVKEFIRATT